jgi:hypothetical protein
MQIHEVKDILNADLLCGESQLDMEVKMGCACDLMSHVLSFITSDDVLLLTGLTTPQVIYSSDAVNIKAICFLSGKRPEEETIELGCERNMVLLGTTWPTYEACGKLYQQGLIGCAEYEHQR